MLNIYDSRNYQVLIDLNLYNSNFHAIYDSRNYQVLIDSFRVKSMSSQYLR